MGAEDLLPLAAATLRLRDDPERVLEISCGEGDGVLFLSREYPRARVRGVDASEAAVRAARARVGLDPEGRVAFKVGRRQSLPFPDDHFDLVVQREGALATAEIARVLRPGGALVLHARAGAADRLGLRRRLTVRRLRASGLALEVEGATEGGRFLVARLRGAGGASTGH